MPEAEWRVLLSCEHGGNRVPHAYGPLFVGRKALLASHRGWDPGALPMARSLARALGAELVPATITRLLVDLNRSPGNRAVFAELIRGFSPERRERLLASYHRPHWARVRGAIAAQRGPVLHVAVHSFTPVLRGATRDFTIGLLYDPKRAREQALAKAWQRGLEAGLGPRSVRRNAPYRGDTDGLTTALRRELPPQRYLGIELELNQRALRTQRERSHLSTLIASSLCESLSTRGR